MINSPAPGGNANVLVSASGNSTGLLCCANGKAQAVFGYQLQSVRGIVLFGADVPLDQDAINSGAGARDAQLSGLSWRFPQSLPAWSLNQANTLQVRERYTKLTGGSGPNPLDNYATCTFYGVEYVGQICPGTCAFPS